MSDTVDKAIAWDAIAAKNVEIAALKVVAKAARRYFVGYVQDEAAEREVCICDEQHEDAKALEEALAALAMLTGY